MRINLFGGPGAGKSATAAWLFAELKREMVSVEHVGEYVKAWAYAGREVGDFDQFYLQAKQMQYEYRFLKAGVKNIVTDSPVGISVVYAPDYLKPILRKTAALFETAYPSVNIFLDRGDKPYIAAGRYQSKEKALEKDAEILHEFEELPLIIFDFNDRYGIRDFILNVVTR